MIDSPSPNDSPNRDGRDGRGRFAAGNPGGPGNPHAAEVGRLRARFLAKLRDTDIDKCLTTLREVMAKGKDSDRLTAVGLLLDRVLGKAVQQDLLERLERLEQLLNDREAVGGRVN